MMATIDKDLLLDKIDRLLKLHNYAIEGWFANTIHNTVWDAPEIETDGDTIYRADAIKAVERILNGKAYWEDILDIKDVLSALPSAEAKGDLISREEAIAIMTGALEQIEETEGIAIVDKVAYRTLEDYAEEAFSTATSAEAVSVEDEKQIENLILFKEYLRGRRDAVQGWIPCSERLPNESDYYLVTHHTYGEYEVDTAWFAHCDDYGGESEWREVEGNKVTAWQPLPTPYKGGDE